MKLLSLDTSHSSCSVALHIEDTLVHYQELHLGKSHSEQLVPMLNSTLQTAGVDTRELDALAVSLGPGSYTGLRIGASTAKGFSYGLDLPLYGVDTLRAVAASALHYYSRPEKIVAATDARRNEIYYGIYDRALNVLSQPEPLILQAGSFANLSGQSVLFAGSGAAKIREIITGNETFQFVNHLDSDARFVGEVAIRFPDHLDMAYFEPTYVKAFYHGSR